MSSIYESTPPEGVKNKDGEVADLSAPDRDDLPDPRIGDPDRGAETSSQEGGDALLPERRRWNRDSGPDRATPVDVLPVD